MNDFCPPASGSEPPLCGVKYNHIGSEANDRSCRWHEPGKKKMRQLGTVQIPTEAFLAVLKLDE